MQCERSCAIKESSASEKPLYIWGVREQGGFICSLITVKTASAAIFGKPCTLLLFIWAGFAVSKVTKTLPKECAQIKLQRAVLRVEMTQFWYCNNFKQCCSEITLWYSPRRALGDGLTEHYIICCKEKHKHICFCLWKCLNCILFWRAAYISSWIFASNFLGSAPQNS